MKVAAVQLEPVPGDVAENLRRCEALADEAGAAGAEWILLPEFFTSGMAFVDAIADAVLPIEGPALDLLRRVAARHGATVGGSWIARDDDGHNRNAFLLVAPDGRVLGRHDKDLPTMWENCFYVGGAPDDDGVIEAGDVTAGAAVCWELMRTQTARRLRGRVDVIVGGSAWWSIPPWPPGAVTRRMEARNARNAGWSPVAMARAVGAPVIHAAHAGRVSCEMPWSPVGYDGHFEGGALICDAAGTVLASRSHREGAGVVVADVAFGRVEPADEIPDRFWMHRRGALPAFVWEYQKLHGRRWYRRHAFGRAVAEHSAIEGGTVLPYEAPGLTR